MEFNDFYDNYMQDIYARAGSKADFTEEQFTEEMCDFLVDQAVIESYDSCFYKKTHQGIRVDAWNYNKDKQELCLFICDFTPSKELRSLTQTDADTFLKRAERFFFKAITEEFYQDLEESLPIYGTARDIAKNKDKIRKVKFYLLSNASFSSRFKGISDRSIEGFESSYDIWDISRRARIEESGKEKEDIIINFSDFVDGGIKYLPAFTDSESCKSYLLALPGSLLAEVYDKYGERLLEQNVRTFLQFRGKVNKGIRNTIKNEPDMFFAYNNGLTVTAEKTEVENGRMQSVKNLQIVNGGQTTASIFMSYLQEKNKENIDLSKVYVQVKMTVIKPELVNEVVPEISRFANTQNRVSNSDFFSNHPFHKRIEDFSRRILAPSADGSLTETYWFYERARGQYANRQAKMTQSQKKKFQIRNPKSQKFTKTDLAKFENSFAKMPHFVSKGAQWNFGKFAEEISGKDDSPGLWDKNDLQFNEMYFKQLIAKTIMFKFLDKNLMRQDWYGGYKANIVTYTLAKFNHEVSRKGKFVDLMGIWQKQKLSTVLQDQLLELAEFVNNIITDTEENVTQYCKKTVCWQRVKDFSFTLSQSVIEELIDSSEIQHKKKHAKRDQKILNKINFQIKVYNKGQEYWSKLYSWASKSNIFSDKEMSILATTSRMNTSPPSEKQCRVILQLEDKAKEEGFFVKGN
ncbi:MAG: AIPR family protein [Balneola sp.]